MTMKVIRAGLVMMAQELAIQVNPLVSMMRMAWDTGLVKFHQVGELEIL